MKKMLNNTIFKVSFLYVVLINTAYGQAQGGLQKVDGFVTTLITLLNGISIGVVTVAIMWAGYKFLFKQADFGEVGKIVGGGLLIGGAGQLATFLLT